MYFCGNIFYRSFVKIIFVFLFFYILLFKSYAEQSYQLNASKIDFSNDYFYASAGVTGIFNNTYIDAYSIKGSTENGNLSILGNISLDNGKMKVKADTIDYNYLNQTGLFKNAEMNISNISLIADNIFQNSVNEYSLDNLALTTCYRTNKLYQILASTGEINNDKIIARNMILKIKNIPILFLPYWEYNINKPVSDIKVGNRSSLGLYTIYNIYNKLFENLSSDTFLHAYSKRGVGLNQKLCYFSDFSDFLISGFFIKDEDPYIRYNSSVERDVISRERYKITSDFTHRFNDLNYIKSTLTYLSDPYVTEEYFRDEFDYYAQPESKLSWVLNSQQIGSELYINNRLNDFYSNTDRIDYSLNKFRKNLNQTPLFYDSMFMISHLENKSNTLETPTMFNEKSFRAVANQSFYIPYKVGIFSIIPKIGLGYTYYSKSNLLENNLDRYNYSSGIEFSFQANKILNENKNWFGKGLKHTIKPYFDYQYSKFSENTNSIIQFDKIDSFNDRERIKIGINNLFQTKRNNINKRFAEIDIYSNYLLNGDNDFTSFYSDARISLADCLTADFKAEINLADNYIPLMISSLVYNKSNLNLWLSHISIDEQKSIFSSRINLYKDQPLSIEGYIRYEENNQDIESASLSLYYSNRCCMRYGIGYRMLRNDEYQILFSLNLL